MAKEKKPEAPKTAPAAQKPETANPKPGNGKPEAAAQNPKAEAQGMSKEAKAVSAEAQKAAQASDTMAAVVKEMENALFAVRFYPVAVNEQAKNEAVEKLVKIYNDGGETVKQMLLYMLHENISQNSEMKVLHTYDYFKMKNPTLEPAQLRMNVYRAMFNYNTSLEGLAEMLRLLCRLTGDDAAKLLTYHFSHACAYESESNRMLRAVITEALGKSHSRYALNALLEYAKYTDNEHGFNRIVAALLEWKDRLEGMKMPDAEKARLRSRLQEVISRELTEGHYG